MHSYPIDAESFPFPISRVRKVGFADQPVIAYTYEISGVLMEVVGLLFWAALIVLFMQAELITG